MNLLYAYKLCYSSCIANYKYPFILFIYKINDTASRHISYYNTLKTHTRYV